MNHGPLLFLGVFCAMATSWFGLVFLPLVQVGRQQPVTLRETAQLYPLDRPGLARQGAELYRSLGCVYCHTQQVRPQHYGTDFERGWGRRRTVAQDYLYDNPAQFGSQRVGPDLTNIGHRQPDAKWHLVHLYNPLAVVEGSTMPPYPFLFEQRKAGPKAAAEALAIPDRFKPSGFEILPRPEARALVAYLQSLGAEATLFEVPPPIRATNAAPAAATNMLAQSATNLAAGAATNPVAASNSASR